MPNLTAAAYAAILDPERKVQGWWGRVCECPSCGKHRSDMSSHCFTCDRKLEFTEVFTGPPDLHTAREHAWRGEEFLIARDCEIYITHNATYVEGPAGTGCPEIANNPNHAAAIAEAVRRIANEVL